jgi:hypothetical protein
MARGWGLEAAITLLRGVGRKINEAIAERLCNCNRGQGVVINRRCAIEFVAAASNAMMPTVGLQAPALLFPQVTPELYPQLSTP